MDVPAAALAELPVLHAYAAEDLRADMDLSAGVAVPPNMEIDAAKAIFKAEGADLAGAYLVESYRQRSFLWLYPPWLRMWISTVPRGLPRLRGGRIFRYGPQWPRRSCSDGCVSRCDPGRGTSVATPRVRESGACRLESGLPTVGRGPGGLHEGEPEG